MNRTNNGVFVDTLIRLLKGKKAPFIIIDTKKQSVLHTQNWMHETANPKSVHGTLIITNDKYNGSYHTSTINCLEYISECTFSFIPMEPDSATDGGVTFTGEYVRIHGIDVFGSRSTIDIAGVPEPNERNGIIFAVISAMITALRATKVKTEQNSIMNFLNAIPFAVCFTDLDGNILGYNYRFEDLAFEGDIQPGDIDQLSINDIRLDMDKSKWEDKYIIKNRVMMNDVEILNSGQWHSVSKTFALMPDSDEMMAIVGIVEDISKQPLMNHEELRMDLINTIFLKKIISGGDKVAFIIECTDMLPFMYLSNNMDILGLDGSIMLLGNLYFSDYIHTSDRQRVIDKFTSDEGIDEKNSLSMSVNTIDGAPLPVFVEYTKTRYIYKNSIIAYGTMCAAT